jgi:phytoene desaturase
MYHLMTHVDLNVGVYYPMGGLYSVIEAIERVAKQHGVVIKTNSPVSKIEVNGQGLATGVVVGGAKFDADVVVGTADLHHVETKLIEEKYQTFPEKFWSNKVPGPSAMLLYLGVKGKIPQLDHHTLLYTDNWSKNFAEVFHKADGNRKVPSPASLYICAPSKTDDSVAPAGYENLFVLVPIAADPSIGGSGDEKFEKAADEIIKQISDWCEIPDLAERIVLKRTYGPRDFFRPKNRSKKIKNLFYAGHNTIPGIGLPMCLIGAELVYKYLVDDKSNGPIEKELTAVSEGGWKGLR